MRAGQGRVCRRGTHGFRERLLHFVLELSPPAGVLGPVRRRAGEAEEPKLGEGCPGAALEVPVEVELEAAAQRVLGDVDALEMVSVGWGVEEQRREGQEEVWGRNVAICSRGSWVCAGGCGVAPHTFLGSRAQIEGRVHGGALRWRCESTVRRRQ